MKSDFCKLWLLVQMSLLPENSHAETVELPERWHYRYLVAQLRNMNDSIVKKYDGDELGELIFSLITL